MDKKILLIEDDVDIADFVKMELEHEGYAVQTGLTAEPVWTSRWQPISA